MSSLVQKFNDEMIEYHLKRIEHGYNAVYAGKLIKSLGGYKAAKKLISSEAKDGFMQLVKRNLLKYSIEAIVIKQEYSQLFSSREIENCKKLLTQYGYIPNEIMNTPMNREFIIIDRYKFYFVQELIPICDDSGLVVEYKPQNQYDKRNTEKLHQYGDGSFCKFSINTEWRGCSGVYSLISSGEVLYIGECIDLYKRFNTGYGNISPRNCYVGGQQTNCKINKLVLNLHLKGMTINVYFHATTDYKRVENLLIRKTNPPYNG